MSTSLTVEEAVSLMVNMDFIPDGETVLSMSEAFLEEAEVEYENASGLDDKQLQVLKIRKEICEARLKLVQMLTESLFAYAIDAKNTLIVKDEKASDENPLMTLASLSEWAYDRFGIAISNKRLFGVISNENVDVLGNLFSSTKVAEQEKIFSTNNTKVPTWEDVTIKIYVDNKIGFSLGKGDFKRLSFLDLGLIGKRKLKPNETGSILIDLSRKKKYPSNGDANGSNKTAISKLRRSLKQLTGLLDDAFLPFNKADGYKPRFTLIDDSRNADERAKREAVHVSYDDNAETNDYDNDGVGKYEPGRKYLEEHDK